MRQSFLILTVLFLLLQTLVAQNPFITNYTIAEGLPSNNIYCAYNDSNGFMWFGTDSGVIRFDGSNFVIYTEEDGLSYNGTARIKEDFSGRLWIMNFDGSVNYFYENKIYNSRNTPFLGDLKNNYYIYGFFQDKDSTIYFYNPDSEIFVVKNDEFIDYQHLDYKDCAEKSESISLFYLNKLENGKFLLWTTSGTFEFSKIEDNPKQYGEVFFSRRVLRKNEKESFVLDGFGDLYVYQNSGGYKKKILRSKTMLVNSIVTDVDDYSWVATFNQGVFCYKNDKIVLHFDITNIQELIIDNENNVWAVSSVDGIYKINRDILKYKFFENRLFDRKGITGLARSNQNGVWATNGESLFFLNDDLKSISKLPVGGSILKNIYQLRNNTILVRGNSTKMYVIRNVIGNAENNTISYGTITKQLFRGKNIVVDSSENNCYSFISNLLYTTSLRKTSTYSVSDIIGLRTGRIKNLFINNQGKLIVNGAFNYTISDSAVVERKYKPFNGKTIQSHVTLDSKNEVINVVNNKLYLLTGEKYYNLTKPFMSQIDYQIKKMIYADSTLFFFTIKTVYFIQNPLKILDGEPLQLNRLNIEFNNVNDLYCRNKTLYIASGDGLMFIPVEDCVSSKMAAPKPYFFHVSLEEDDYDITSGIIELKDRKRLSIEFSSLNYSSIPSNYSYKLEGVDANWITGNETKVVYSHLDPGNYIFKLRSRKNREQFSKTIELPVIVHPTLIQRPITKLLLVLFLLLSIFFIIRFFYQRKIQKNETEQLLMTLEHKALQSMMNPHFIFNALGSIQGFLLENKSTEAGTYLSQFARLIRQNMNSLKSNFICVDDEVERLRNYIELEKLRLNNKFTCQIEVDDRLDSYESCIPSMIIQPFVENAIWHGISSIEGDARIKILFKYVDSKCIKVIVEDNGIGMDANKLFTKSGHGLNMGVALTKRRLRLIGQRQGVESKISVKNITPGALLPGTQIIIIVPIVNDFV